MKHKSLIFVIFVSCSNPEKPIESIYMPSVCDTLHERVIECLPKAPPLYKEALLMTLRHCDTLAPSIKSHKLTAELVLTVPCGEVIHYFRKGFKE